MVLDNLVVNFMTLPSQRQSFAQCTGRPQALFPKKHRKIDGETCRN